MIDYNGLVWLRKSHTNLVTIESISCILKDHGSSSIGLHKMYWLAAETVGYISTPLLIFSSSKEYFISGRNVSYIGHVGTYMYMHTVRS